MAGARRGASCAEVCAEQLAGTRCSALYLPVVNDCGSLKAAFDCSSCGDSIGGDQPAFVARDAPAGAGPGSCLVNGDATLFSCDAKYEWTFRLCPCGGDEPA